MKRIIFGAMAAAALLACSQEQVIELNRANDEISFSVVAENQTRASAVYCANNLLPKFYVAATYTKGDVAQWYFQNDEIKNESTTTTPKWVNQTTTRYWADGGTLDFYAIYNGTMNMNDIAAAPAVNFTPATNVAEQVDLLYAVTKGKEKSDEAVALNFRHALSQIEFKAKNTNKQLYVKITGVRVGQTPGVGVFTYPSDDTDDNFRDHTQGTTHNYVTGSWTSTTTPTDYKVEFAAVNVPGNSTPVGLTLSSDKDNVTNSMLLIPATTTAWTPADEETAYDGTYLAVNCNIYNVAGTEYADSDICLHTGWAVIPVAFDWQPGKKYIYTFVFGEGNGGYEDDPDDPKPVLTPISYTVTVDDFQKGDNIDVEMEY